MASSFAWLDFAESDRQRAMQVIDLFREKSTVDELGFAPIRDGFADYLFPGTSTIQTRTPSFSTSCFQSLNRDGAGVPRIRSLRGDPRGWVDGPTTGAADGGLSPPWSVMTQDGYAA